MGLKKRILVGLVLSAVILAAGKVGADKEQNRLDQRCLDGIAWACKGER